jgi:hypothetical protein
LPGSAQPLEDHRDAHDDIAKHHDAVVDIRSMIERGEQTRQADGEDEHADHLHHGRDPINPVVRVESRSEPGKIHPGPAGGEHREAEAQKPGGVVPLGKQVGKLRCSQPKGDNEGQVEQKLQRRCDPVILMRIAPAHRRGQVMGGQRAGECVLFGHSMPSVCDLDRSSFRTFVIRKRGVKQGA